MPQRSSKARNGRPAAGPVTLLIGTRKGAFLFKSDRARRRWTPAGPHFLGQIVNHVVLDPRDGKTLLCAARTGHLGPTVFRSTDRGRTWKEAQRPPAFPKARRGREGPRGRTRVLADARARREPGVWYAGISPHGLFRSRGRRRHLGRRRRLQRQPHAQDLDRRRAGATHARRRASCTRSTSTRATPRHLYIAHLERRHVREHGPRRQLAAAQSRRRRRLPAGPEPGVRPRRALRARRTRSRPTSSTSRTTAASTAWTGPARRWERIGNNMPKKIGDIGFPDGAASARSRHRRGCFRWTAPRCGRASAPAASRRRTCTRDAGKSWQRQDRGLPRSAGLVHGEAPGDVRRRTRPGRRLLRHHERRDLDERQAKASAGTASRATCRRSIPSRPDRRLDRDEGSDSHASCAPTPAAAPLGRGARHDARRDSRRPRPPLPRHPLPHDRRAGRDPAPHQDLRQRRAGARHNRDAP